MFPRDLQYGPDRLSRKGCITGKPKPFPGPGRESPQSLHLIFRNGLQHVLDILLPNLDNSGAQNVKKTPCDFNKYQYQENAEYRYYLCQNYLQRPVVATGQQKDARESYRNRLRASGFQISSLFHPSCPRDIEGYPFSKGTQRGGPQSQKIPT